MSSYIKESYSTEEVFWIYEVGDVITELKISKIYNRDVLLWEFADSNFFSRDKFVIITKDRYIFNGKKTR